MTLRPDISRSVVVTGGSSGVGAAFCEAAAHAGWHVWIGYGAGAARASALHRNISTHGGSATPIHLPLADSKHLLEMAPRVAIEPLPEALVLCASAAPDVSPFTKITADQLRRQLEIVVGNHLLIVELWRRSFRRLGGGHVLAVLTSGLRPPTAAHMASYVASKGALDALLRAAVSELGPAGLRLTVAYPGYIETPMLSAFEPRLLERARLASPHRRFLDPEDVATTLLKSLNDPPIAGTIRELHFDNELGLVDDRATA